MHQWGQTLLNRGRASVKQLWFVQKGLTPLVSDVPQFEQNRASGSGRSPQFGHVGLGDSRQRRTSSSAFDAAESLGVGAGSAVTGGAAVSSSPRHLA